MSGLRIVMLGLSVTSSWGNGHATNYRALVAALSARGHDVVFLERDVPWYSANRDLPNPPHGRTELYRSVAELEARFCQQVAEAHLVLVGSYVPDGVAVGRWVTATAGGVTAFYDIDTPVTIAALERGDCQYLTAELVPRFDLYLSFTAGPTLELLRDRYGASDPVGFYCLVDADAYRPVAVPLRWDIGYLGTYSADRQPALDELLLEPARRRPELRAVVAGPKYPDDLVWPANVERIEHLAPADHPAFYSAQRLTVNVTRADMVRAGWSPSVRLFEAAACAVPVVSDRWAGLDTVFVPSKEIFLADSASDVLGVLDRLDDTLRRQVGEGARQRVIAEHTGEQRAEQLEELVATVLRRRS